jgi:diguanylate cyclase (GGDEF)-like protein
LEREITERQQAQAKLVELATTDSLTGLHNRRYFMETATQEFERARRYRMPLSLLMVDADRFKLINDRFGHHMGDEVLKTLAMIGQHQLREIDLFARLGGEEFAILFPQTDFVDARAAAERLRQAIAEHTVDTEQGLLNFTVSLGLASLNPVTVDLEDLLRQADIALYQAKQNGRNRVEPALVE